MGVDPVDLATDHVDRITHIHPKSVRPAVYQEAVPGKCSFYQAILEGIFTVPADPEGGFDPIFDALRRRRYEGRIVVEASRIRPGPTRWTAHGRRGDSSASGSAYSRCQCGASV